MTTFALNADGLGAAGAAAGAAAAAAAGAGAGAAAAAGAAVAAVVATGDLTLQSPQTTGLRAGYQCSYGLGPDLSDDQRTDDAHSLCFDSPPLDAPQEILGEPWVELELACDQPQALLAVRLCDVAPDGSSLRTSYGLLNLAHRDGDAYPTPLEPGRSYRVRIGLCGIAYAFPAGHRIRLALSNAYWPIAWPSPVASTITLRTGVSRLHLPLRAPHARDAALAPFGEPQGSPPLALVETRARATGRSLDRIEEHLGERRIDLVRTRDRGAWRTTDTDVDYDTRGELRFSIQADDPSTAAQELALTTTMGRPGWRIRTEVSTRIRCTAQAFQVQARLDAWDGEEQVFSRSWDMQITRDNL